MEHNHTPLNPNNPIGQINIFALPRSGGTILNIFLRKFLCYKCSLIHPDMIHSDKAIQYGPLNIKLLRHPLGIFGSQLHVDSIDKSSYRIRVSEHNAKAKLKDILEMYRKFEEFFDKNKDCDSISVIKYEDYHKKYDYFKKIAKEIYKIDIDEEEFDKFKNDYAVEEVRNDIYSGQQKERDFRPNHVSTAKGDNFLNVRLIPDSIRQEVEDKIFPFIDKYGYERIKLSDYPFEKSRDLLA